jgi:hypothetical protein
MYLLKKGITMSKSARQSMARKNLNMYALRLFFVFFFPLLLPGCTPSRNAARVSVERKGHGDRVMTKISNSQALYEMGEIDAAIANLALVVDQNHYCPAQDQAYELLVTWLLETNRYEEAKRYGSRFLFNNPKSDFSDRIVALFKERNIDTRVGLPLAVWDLAPNRESNSAHDIELDGILK